MGGHSKRLKKVKSPDELRRIAIVKKANALGVPVDQIKHGRFDLHDVARLDPGEKVETLTTLVNRGGTPVARWKACRLLSDSQVAAIDRCEHLWSQLNGKSLVMDYYKTPGSGSGDGWAEQEALTDLSRFKSYVPPKWWAIFESVCRFDEPAGFAGSRLTDCRNDQVAAARTTVQFVADVICWKERLALDAAPPARYGNR